MRFEKGGAAVTCNMIYGARSGRGHQQRSELWRRPGRRCGQQQSRAGIGAVRGAVAGRGAVNGWRGAAWLPQQPMLSGSGMAPRARAGDDAMGRKGGRLEMW